MYTFTDASTGNPVTWITAVSSQIDGTVQFTLNPVTPSDVKMWTINVVVQLTAYGAATSSPASTLTINVQCPAVPSFSLGPSPVDFTVPLTYMVNTGVQLVATSEVIDDFNGLCSFPIITRVYQLFAGGSSSEILAISYDYIMKEMSISFIDQALIGQ